MKIQFCNINTIESYLKLRLIKLIYMYMYILKNATVGETKLYE